MMADVGWIAVVQALGILKDWQCFPDLLSVQANADGHGALDESRLHRRLLHDRPLPRKLRGPVEPVRLAESHGRRA